MLAIRRWGGGMWSSVNSSSDEWQSESGRIVSVTTSPMPFGFVSLAFFLLLYDSKSDTPINIYNTPYRVFLCCQSQDEPEVQDSQMEAKNA